MENVKINQSAARIFSLCLSGGAIFSALAVLLFKVYAVSGIYYDAVSRELPDWLPLWAVAIAGGAAALAATLPWKAQWQTRLTEAEKTVRPGWLLYLTLQASFPWIFVSILLLGYIAFRAGNRLKISLPMLSEKSGLVIALAGWGILIVWGYYVQICAYDSLYFIYGDWNQYASHYQLLIGGNGSFIDWCIGAGHWNLGINLLMSAVLKLCYAPETIFYINALCIASAAPLGYWLSRKCGLSVWQSLLWLPLAALNPALSNQYLAHFYGFHPIVFFIPVIMGFFIAREYRNRWVMGIFFVLSLLIQETVCVFWFGYGLVLLLRRKWISAALLLVLMPVLFYLLSQVLMPFAYRNDNYAQMFHYAQLGETPFQVLCSPVTRPGAFWGTLFSANSIYFILALLIPFAFAVLLEPWLLLAVVPLGVGVCLQDSFEFKSVVFWYGVEITVVAMVLTVINWGRGGFVRFGRLLNWGFPAENIRKCSICSVVVTTLLCAWCFSFIPGNKGPASRILTRKDAGELKNFIVGNMKENTGKVIATSRLRGQFQFMFPTGDIRSEFVPGDVIILDLHDPLIDRPEDVEFLRKRIVADRRVVPLNYAVWENHTIVIFEVQNKPYPLQMPKWLFRIKQADFVRIGTPVETPFKELDFRFLYGGRENIFLVQLRERTGADYEFILELKTGNHVKEVVIRFANGVYPAYIFPKDMVFRFAVPGEKADSLKLNIRKIDVEKPSNE